MATIVTFATDRQAEVEIDVTNRRLRQTKPFIPERGWESLFSWCEGEWVDYESTSHPIGIRVVQFKGVRRDGYTVGSGTTIWNLVGFVSIRTELDVEPEPELEDLVGPMRSDVIIRGAAELAASIFVQQGWADEWDPEEIERELGECVDAGFDCVGDPPLRRLLVHQGRSGRTHLAVILDSIGREDFETEA